MRKILSITLVALLICLSATVSFARVGDTRIGRVSLKSTGLVEPHTHVVTSPIFIYELEFSANVANTWVALLDTSTTGAASTLDDHISTLVSPNNSRLLADVREPTAGDFTRIVFDEPLEAINGLMVSYGTTNGSTYLLEQLGELTANGTNVAEVLVRYSSE